MSRRDSIDEEIRVHNLFFSGRNLELSEIVELRKEILCEPENLDLKIKLAAFLSRKFYDSSELQNEYCKTLIWWIENHPSHSIMSLMDIEKGFKPFKNYLKIISAWKKKVSDNPESIEILIAAARAMDSGFPAESEKLLLKAKLLEPRNEEVAYLLKNLYSHWGPGFEQNALAACKHLIEIREEAKILNISEPPSAELADLAFKAKDFDLAQIAANNVLHTIETNIQMQFNLEASHKAHTVLGKICFANGDLRGAVEHLFDSLPGKIPHKEFIPDFSLLAEIYYAGAKGAVQKFLDVAPLFAIELRRWHFDEPIDQILKYKLPSEERYSDLADLPRSAYDSGRFELAEQTALEYQRMLIEHKDEPDSGIHIGEVVLGQLALERKDTSKALEHLQNSISKVGHLSMRTLDFHLCFDLLEFNQKDSVLDYLNNCRMLYAHDEDIYVIDEWVTQIENGETPWEWTV